MKHNLKITLILIGMFVLTQLIGLYVINAHSPIITQTIDDQGIITNVTDYDLPYGFEPPTDISPNISLISIIIALIIAIGLMFFFMKFNLELVLRIWFFLVVIIALSISLNAILSRFPSYLLPSLIAIIIAIPLAYLKIFKRHIIIHNFTELLIYPGIAVIFIPWFSVLTIFLFLILISVYDIWAVNHTGHMQKMANYQIKTLKVFGGFLVPSISKKQKQTIRNMKQKYKESKLSEKDSKAKSKEKISDKKQFKINMAVLGGGDIVWPMILAGVVFHSMGIIPALIVIIGSTLGLSYLFYVGEKTKAYPAMPYITVGCFISLGLIYLLGLI